MLTDGKGWSWFTKRWWKNFAETSELDMLWWRTCSNTKWCKWTTMTPRRENCCFLCIESIGSCKECSIWRRQLTVLFDSATNVAQKKWLYYSFMCFCVRSDEDWGKYGQQACGLVDSEVSASICLSWDCYKVFYNEGNKVCHRQTLYFDTYERLVLQASCSSL